MSVIGIQRAERFSPNSVGKDLDILKAVVGRFDGKIISEDNIQQVFPLFNKGTSVVFSMARSAETVEILRQIESDGVEVINPAKGVEMCQRSRLFELMRSKNLPIPADEGQDSPSGYWLKRGDAAAQSHDDVVYCKDRLALEHAKEAFVARGINDMVVQAHVVGDLVKFYGVEGTGFFRTFYPTDDGMSKFGDEAVNGTARHFFFQRERLQAVAELTSRLASTPVYGGDAIVNAEGDFVIIDFNDWPSFSRCRDEAAEAIVNLARYRIN